ncbi:MAG: uridine kinase [Ruminococcaceae bacterium]|nr:uridine kinase [Oscillospiraceae bacterium]
MYINKFDNLTKIIKKHILENKSIVLAIDGRCGGGKTFLSEYLQRIFGCNVIHVDDFFLPFELRNDERMSKIGGNIHIERFMNSVLKPLMSGRKISYRPYVCKKGDFSSDDVCFMPGKLTIIEGTYSCMDEFINCYDMKIFVDVSPCVQEIRLKKRCTPGEYGNFKKLWIPREELYFEKCDIRNKCDYIIDTSDIG